MCSYTSVGGVPSCASHWALTELLRDAWGVDGYVVSDCLALQVMMQAHHYLPYDIPLAAATAVNAGVDWNCGCVLANGTAAALARGLLNESAVDAAVSRILRVLFELGEFDADVPYRAFGADRLDTPAHRALAQAAAEQGLVLLKNGRGALPLSRAAKLAFVGPSADDGGVMQSSYGGDCRLCANHTPLRAARAAGLDVSYTRGCDVFSEDTSGFAAAAAAVAAADAAVLFLGLDFPCESEWGNGPVRCRAARGGACGGERHAAMRRVARAALLHRLPSPPAHPRTAKTTARTCGCPACKKA
jgi:beta-glucosidase-like glycosyl hydrolase